MATTIVTNSAKRVYPYGVDLTTATIKAALFTNAATITSTSTLYSGLSNEVSSGGGYATGGNTVTGLAWSGTTSASITGSVTSWTSATFTFRNVVFYDVATSKIITATDFGSDQSVTSGTLVLSFDSNGMLLVTSS